jgi:hypothetical protein
MSGEIWLGDLAIALRELGPLDARQRETVLAALRLTGRRVGRPPVRSEGTRTREATYGGASDQAPLEVPAALSSDDNGEPVPLLQPVAVEAGRRHFVFRGVPLAEVRPEHLRPRVPFMPLLAPRTADVILRTAVQRWIPGGMVETVALVERIARARPVTRVPRRPVPTLRFGTEVLVDVGQGMEPFVQDRADVLRRLQRIVGHDKVAVRYFQNAPMRGVARTPGGRATPYRPVPGLRILVLSDLGLCGPTFDFRRAGRSEWERLAQAADAAGAQITVLLPVPPARWPAWSMRLFPMICWDRTATAVEASEQIRHRR